MAAGVEDRRLTPEQTDKLKSVGIHLPRERKQDGHVRKEGVRPHWKGHYFQYVRQSDGTEKRVHHKVDLGACRELTKKAAQEKLREIISGELGITSPVEATLTLKQFYEKKFLKIKLRTWQDTNQAHERYMFEKYVIGPLGQFPIDKITKDMVADEMNRLFDEGYSKSTVKKFKTNINSLLEEAADQIEGFRNPIRKLELPANLPKEKKRVLSWDEIWDLLRVADERESLMLCILLMLGTRGGEFFALRRNDYQPGGLMLDEVVRPKHGVSPIMKTELSKDLMYLPPELEQQLVAWMEKMPDQRPEAFLFPSEAGTPIAANNFNKRDLKSLVTRAKKDRVKRGLEVPEGYLQGITPQSFRTTCATYSGSRELGGIKDAQAIMRHSSPETTGKTYMQSIPESVKSTMQAVAEKVRSGQTPK